MAFTNQFSLSLELTKLIPFGSLITNTSRGMLHLMRELQDSGSDMITEADLAEVFGRNRIECGFESTFRTAVKKSVIHKISEVAGLVIEAGAGPTVRRSLGEPAYFSTILQLSLLTYTHDLSHLARCLAKALENRAEGATTPVALPGYDALKGTLRACREQTSGFPWEFALLLVEETLIDIVSGEGPTITRPVPVAVLQALLDSFTAVQYLPENRFIHIESIFGISTIVVWAHRVLGLTVCVMGDSHTVRFGDGFEPVFIDTRIRLEIKASLLNETKDLCFQVTNSDEDLPLDAACRHPVLGFGTRALELPNFHKDIIEGLAQATVTSCINLAQKESEKTNNVNVDRREKNICPSAQRVVAVVGKMLFPNYDNVFENLNLDNEQPCLATSIWTCDMLPENLARHLRIRDNRPVLRDYTLRLSYLLLVLSMVDNLDTCGDLSLDVFGLTDVDYQPFRLPTVHEAFRTVALLLQGRAFKSAEFSIEYVSVLSAWGWSICVSSIADLDLSEIRSGIAVCHGVPMRSGIRKRLIVDTFHKLSGLKTRNDTQNNLVAIAKAGDKVALASWTKSKKSRYFINVTDVAFQVNKTISSEPMDISDGFFERRITPFGGELRVGL